MWSFSDTLRWQQKRKGYGRRQRRPDREQVYGAIGPTGRYTHNPGTSAASHSRSKACLAKTFCGSCYEKAKGRDFR